MIFIQPLAVDVLLLTVATLLLSSGARQLHYRDVPYLFVRRRLWWGSLSFFLHGAVVMGVMLMLLTRSSAVWWVAAGLGALPALMTFGYAVQVIRHPRRVAWANKDRWKGPELTP